MQALVSPTDALLAMCSSAAYGTKEGVREHSKKLPAEVELERLASKWGVSTGLCVQCLVSHKVVGNTFAVLCTGITLVCPKLLH